LRIPAVVWEFLPFASRQNSCASTAATKHQRKPLDTSSFDVVSGGNGFACCVFQYLPVGAEMSPMFFSGPVQTWNKKNTVATTFPSCLKLFEELFFAILVCNRIWTKNSSIWFFSSQQFVADRSQGGIQPSKQPFVAPLSRGTNYCPCPFS
jgi:hypothetical protein